MGKEIIINARKDQTRIAIVEDDELAEMYFEDPDNERTLGDIYLGRVRRIMPSIQAAFIDIGQASDAFLHFSDIADNVGDMIRLLEMDAPDVGKVELSAPTRRRRPRGPSGTQVSMDDDEDDAEEQAGKKGSSPKRSNGGDDKSDSAFRPEDLRKDQKILVKIVKEPISSKGSRVSTDISLAGRFLVLVPLADYVAVSKKIVSYKERRRLRALARSLLPEGFGLIVRTVAEDKNAKALDTDLRLLVEKWRRIEKRLAEVKNPPAVLHQDVNMVSSVIRDLFSDDYEQILIDDQRVYRNVKGYIQAVAPQMAPAVKLHGDRQPIFQAAGIEKAVKQAFESRVDLPSGGYLIIETTEAMHVIDVNSGRAGRGLSQEQNSLKVNMESARMLAQQLRLRDLGGIIVVDFIDLRDDKNRKKVYDELKKHFRKDRAVTKILPMSDFGLMQITRQRLRPSITTVKKNGEAKTGSGEPTKNTASTAPAEPVAPRITPEQWREKLERWVVRYYEKGKRSPLVLRVHPFAKSYLGKGVAKAPLKWFWKYRLRIRLETDTEQNPLSFRFFDADSGDELTRRRRSGRKRGKKKGRKGDRKSGSGDDTNKSRRSDGSKRKSKKGEGAKRKTDGKGRSKKDASQGDGKDRDKSSADGDSGKKSGRSGGGSSSRRSSGRGPNRRDADQSDSSRKDSSRSSSSRSDSSRSDSSRSDSSRSDASRSDARRSDARRSGSRQSDSGGSDANRSDSSRSDSGRRGSGHSNAEGDSQKRDANRRQSERPSSSGKTENQNADSASDKADGSADGSDRKKRSRGGRSRRGGRRGQSKASGRDSANPESGESGELSAVRDGRDDRKDSNADESSDQGSGNRPTDKSQARAQDQTSGDGKNADGSRGAGSETRSKSEGHESGERSNSSSRETKRESDSSSTRRETSASKGAPDPIRTTFSSHHRRDPSAESPKANGVHGKPDGEQAGSAPPGQPSAPTGSKPEQEA